MILLKNTYIDRLEVDKRVLRKGVRHMAKKKLLTYAGLKALEEELENLKVVKRREVATKIREAR